MSSGSALLLAGLVVFRATQAQAQTEPESVPPPSPESAPAPEAPAPTQRQWYGWQTMLTDTGAIALWLLAAAAHDAHYTSGSGHAYEQASTAAIALGLGVYALGGPAVHAAHGKLRRAGGSLALRTALPLLSGVVGLGVGMGACGRGSDSSEACPTASIVLGMMLGGVAASAIDASAISYERVPAPAAGVAGLTFLPTSGGGTVSLMGRF